MVSLTSGTAGGRRPRGPLTRRGSFGRPRDRWSPPFSTTRSSRAVDHRGGPVLVLAGPGTGKTTTIVEAVVQRVERGEITADQALVLTFSRRAAAELRERIAARLGRTIREPIARTFHSYAFGLLRADAARRGEQPPRLLSGARARPRRPRAVAGRRRGGRDVVAGAAAARTAHARLRPRAARLRATRGRARCLRARARRTRASPQARRLGGGRRSSPSNTRRCRRCARRRRTTRRS